MKKKFTFDDFKKIELSNEQKNRIKGGRTRFRRPGSTTTTAIWDDVEIRKEKKILTLIPDLVLRFSRRGG